MGRTVGLAVGRAVVAPHRLGRAAWHGFAIGYSLGVPVALKKLKTNIK